MFQTEVDNFEIMNKTCLKMWFGYITVPQKSWIKISKADKKLLINTWENYQLKNNGRFGTQRKQILINVATLTNIVQKNSDSPSDSLNQ